MTTTVPGLKPGASKYFLVNDGSGLALQLTPDASGWALLAKATAVTKVNERLITHSVPEPEGQLFYFYNDATLADAAGSPTSTDFKCSFWHLQTGLPVVNNGLHVCLGFSDPDDSGNYQWYFERAVLPYGSEGWMFVAIDPYTGKKYCMMQDDPGNAVVMWPQADVLQSSTLVKASWWRFVEYRPRYIGRVDQVRRAVRP